MSRDKVIRELAKNAGLKLMNDETLTLGYLTTSQRKFAYSIIKECCKICDSFSEECSPDESHSEAIKKHFDLD